MSSDNLRAGVTKAAVVRATLPCPVTMSPLLGSRSPPGVKKKKKKGGDFECLQGCPGESLCCLLGTRGLGPEGPCSACGSAAGGLPATFHTWRRLPSVLHLGLLQRCPKTPTALVSYLE